VTVAEVNGVPLAYDEAGEGPPLLLVHAGIADRRMWDDVVDDLAASHRVVRPDLRGFGDTPLPDGPFSHAADLAALARHLGIDRAAVCGVSMGGAIAHDLAAGHADLVDRLVLVAPPVGGWEWSAAMREFDEAEEAALARGDLDAATELNVAFWLAGPTRSVDDVDRRLRERVARMQRRAFALTNPAAEPTALVPDRHLHLHELAVPTLVTVGALDQPDLLGIAEHLAACIPGARLEVLPGVAHLPPMEDPARFASLVLDHLGADRRA
jgi:3-oxoadipate enol-lactonase